MTAYQWKDWCATYEYKGRHWLPASLLTEENQHMVTDDSIYVADGNTNKLQGKYDDIK